MFARLMIDKLENGDINGRKAYLRAVVSAIEVGDKTIRIIGCKDVLQAAIAGKQTANENVRGFVRKWRALRESNPCFRQHASCRRSAQHEAAAVEAEGLPDIEA